MYRPLLILVEAERGKEIVVMSITAFAISGLVGMSGSMQFHKDPVLPTQLIDKTASKPFLLLNTLSTLWTGLTSFSDRRFQYLSDMLQNITTISPGRICTTDQERRRERQFISELRNRKVHGSLDCLTSVNPRFVSTPDGHKTVPDNGCTDSDTFYNYCANIFVRYTNTSVAMATLVLIRYRSIFGGFGHDRSPFMKLRVVRDKFRTLSSYSSN